MKWLKICLLLLITLAVMRAGSWAVGWALVRLSPLRERAAAIVANLLAFAAFVTLLQLELLEGEPIEWLAVLFALVVFAIYTAMDFWWWTPWTRRARRSLAAGRSPAPHRNL